MALPLRERFEAKYIPEPNSGCFLWTGSICSGGYGTIGRGGRYGKTEGAHRVAWEIHKGEIPSGLSVLHKCDVRSCVNPDHLFLGTREDNMRDAVVKGRNANRNTKKTHCIHGHPFEGDNLYIWPKHKSRICRACKRKTWRRWWLRKKQII